MSIKDELPKFEYWRKKANEARATADQMTTGSPKTWH